MFELGKKVKSYIEEVAPIPFKVTSNCTVGTIFSYHFVLAGVFFVYGSGKSRRFPFVGRVVRRSTASRRGRFASCGGGFVRRSTGDFSFVEKYL